MKTAQEYKPSHGGFSEEALRHDAAIRLLSTIYKCRGGFVEVHTSNTGKSLEWCILCNSKTKS